jgi:hypothetical protein
MVKKYAYRLPSGAPEKEKDEPSSRRALEATNEMVYGVLNSCKDHISRAPVCWRWDAAKRQANPYELVGGAGTTDPGTGTGIGIGIAHSPVSRSFFKLWEMLIDYGESDMGLVDGSAGMRAAFLAEGPGGFVEAFAAYRKARGGSADELHCITLEPPTSPSDPTAGNKLPGGIHGKGASSASEGGGVPSWKLSSVRRLVESTRSSLVVHAGADGTGDLYNVDNVDHFVEAAGGDGSCDLVTADGGFDFSGDFNAQEGTSARLIAREAYAAIRLQRRGGTFVLKLFDVSQAPTMALLHALRSCYTDVRLVKPHTSRPANSEKYAVCTRFIGPLPAAVMRALREERALPPCPIKFMRALVHYNVVFVTRQVACIGTTIVSTIQRPQQQHRSKQAIHRKQLEKAVRWCHKYRMPFRFVGQPQLQPQPSPQQPSPQQPPPPSQQPPPQRQRQRHTTVAVGWAAI